MIDLDAIRARDRDYDDVFEAQANMSKDIAHRLVAWPVHDRRALLAEVDRLRACRDELRDVTEAMDDPTINNTRTLVEAVRDLRLQRDSWRREAELNAEAADQSVTYARQLAFARRKIEAAQESVQRLLEKGKGTWPGTDYIRDDTWHYWRGEDAGLRQALCIIDGAMQRSKR